MQKSTILIATLTALVLVSSLGCAICQLFSQGRAGAYAVPPPPTNTPKPTFTATPTETPRPPATPTPPSTPTPTPVPPTPTSPPCNKLSAAFEADVTVPDGTQFQPGQSFDKTWRIRNDGDCPWGEGYKLAFASGSKMGAPDSASLPPTKPGETADVTVKMTAPQKGGTYSSFWQAVDDKGQPFGQKIFVKIVVPGAEPPPPPEQPKEEEKPPPPEKPKYQFEPAPWYPGEPNKGLTQVRGHIKDPSGNPVNGFSVRAVCGSFQVLSFPSGPSSVAPRQEAGYYDLALGQREITCDWILQVVRYECNEWFNAECKNYTPLSEEVHWHSEPGGSIVTADWKCNWDCHTGINR